MLSCPPCAKPIGLMPIRCEPTDVRLHAPSSPLRESLGQTYGSRCHTWPLMLHVVPRLVVCGTPTCMRTSCPAFASSTGVCGSAPPVAWLLYARCASTLPKHGPGTPAASPAQPAPPNAALGFTPSLSHNGSTP